LARARTRTIVELCSVVVIGALGVACADETSSSNARSVVVDVVDGDTVVVRLDGRDEHVRLIGIDTPETKHPTKPVQCHGPEATAFVDELLPRGTAVRLERDVEGRDQFGRLLAYLHRETDGLFVNVEIARRGLARPLVIEPNVAHVREVADAVNEARAANRGLWGACPADAS
jgi:micrococcal nuclease